MLATATNRALTQLPETGSSTYDFQIRKFNTWLGGRELNARELTTYLSNLVQMAPPATATLAKYALKKAITQALAGQGRVAEMAQADLLFRQMRTGSIDGAVKGHRILREDEIEEMAGLSSRRTGLKIRFLAITGLRVSEMLSIRIRDCRWKGTMVHIRIVGKGRKQREVFVPASLFKDVALCFRSRDILFSTRTGRPMDPANVWMEIRKAGKRIGRDDVHPHLLRHSFATNTIVQKGKSLKAVSRYLGHSSTSITADLYVHDELSPGDLFSDGAA